jgi:hypothetical protein
MATVVERFAERMAHTFGRSMVNRGSSEPLSVAIDAFAAQGDQLNARLGSLADSRPNRARLAHIIGIERWGAARLGVFLGDPLVEGEYDAYCPPQDDWSALCAAFATARAESVARLRQIAAQGVSDRQEVLHNGYGTLTVRGWLRYMQLHAAIESTRLR